LQHFAHKNGVAEELNFLQKNLLNIPQKIRDAVFPELRRNRPFAGETRG